MKIGILGGAFNPPHIGHLILAQEAVEALGLDKVFFIPTNISPHKKRETPSAPERLEMVKLTISGNRCFEALDLEIKRGGVSYTIDTVRALKNTYSGDTFYLIIGSDLANTFSTWRNFDELKKEVKVAVARRENYPLQEKDNFMVMDITQVAISSSQIRQLAGEERSIRYFVRDSVAEYIRQQGLYEKY